MKMLALRDSYYEQDCAEPFEEEMFVGPCQGQVGSIYEDEECGWTGDTTVRDYGNGEIVWNCPDCDYQNEEGF